MRISLFSVLVLCSCLWGSTAAATMHTQVIDYKIDSKSFQGFLAYDDAAVGRRPGVILVHDWMGMGDFIKDRAKQVAALGYVAFAADIYGKGIVAHDHVEAGKIAGAYMNDRNLLRVRMQAALDVIKKDARVDAARIAAMGYCFGGMAALELSRSGAPLVGVASLHGGLATPTPQDAAHIKGAVLVLTGADDPMVPEPARLAFENEMRAAKIDWQMHVYGGVMHAFSVPTANAPHMGIMYNARAERRSWQTLCGFFREIFNKTGKSAQELDSTG